MSGKRTKEDQIAEIEAVLRSNMEPQVGAFPADHPLLQARDKVRAPWKPENPEAASAWRGQPPDSRVFNALRGVDRGESAVGRAGTPYVPPTERGDFPWLSGAQARTAPLVPAWSNEPDASAAVPTRVAPMDSALARAAIQFKQDEGGTFTDADISKFYGNPGENQSWYEHLYGGKSDAMPSGTGYVTAQGMQSAVAAPGVRYNTAAPAPMSLQNRRIMEHEQRPQESAPDPMDQQIEAVFSALNDPNLKSRQTKKNLTEVYNTMVKAREGRNTAAAVQDYRNQMLDLGRQRLSYDQDRTYADRMLNLAKYYNVEVPKAKAEVKNYNSQYYDRIAGRQLERAKALAEIQKNVYNQTANIDPSKGSVLYGIQPTLPGQPMDPSATERARSLAGGIGQQQANSFMQSLNPNSGYEDTGVDAERMDLLTEMRSLFPNASVQELMEQIDNEYMSYGGGQ